MDPNETLRIVLRLSKLRLDTGKLGAADSHRLAQAALDLDHWLERGGFLPERWRASRAMKD